MQSVCHFANVCGISLLPLSLPGKLCATERSAWQKSHRGCVEPLEKRGRATAGRKGLTA